MRDVAGKAETAQGGHSRGDAAGRAPPPDAIGWPAWRPWLAPSGLALVAGAVLAALAIAPTVFGSPAWSAVLAPIGLAALVAAAFTALRVAGAASDAGLGRLGPAADAAAAAPIIGGPNQTRFAPERAGRAAPSPAPQPFQQLFANAPVGIAMIDRFGRFVEANRAAGELLGASPDKLSGAELTGF